MIKLLTAEIDLDTGVAIKETYRQDHKVHRDPGEGPALIQRCSQTGAAWLEEYRVNGMLHRTDGPASIERNMDGTLFRVQYFQNGKLHRDPTEGPADVMYGQSGAVFHEQYMLRGRHHRDPKNGPAEIVYDWQTGKAWLEEYWQSGKKLNAPERSDVPLLRRDDKPAP